MLGPSVLPSLPEDLSVFTLILQHEPDVVAHTNKANTKGAEMDGSLGLAGIWTSLVRNPQASGTLSQKARWIVPGIYT